MKKTVKITAYSAAFLALLVIAALFLLSNKNRRIAPAATASNTTDGKINYSAEQIAAGKAIAIAGDCVACHSTPSQAPMAGGLPMETPFGMIYSTNITPDPKTGIGHYSREDFHRAVKFGYGKDKGNLYPAMPYTAYRKLSDADIDALWAYIQSLAPVAQPNRANQLDFPANIRMLLTGWNTLFFSDTEFSPQAQKNAEWNRGKYLVEGAGHCGECHTPRNVFGALQPSKALHGALLEGWEASDIRRVTLQKQGWTSESLVQFFQAGESNRGVAVGSMFSAIQHSLSQMPEKDLQAMAGYLLDTPAPTTETAEIITYLDADQQALAGYATYATYCAGCHARDGQGKPHATPAMQGNSAFSMDSSYNAIAVILRGLPKKVQSLEKAASKMDGFSELSDAEIAELVNFTRQTWGGRTTGEVSAKMVGDIRTQLKQDGWLGTQGAHATN